MTTLEVAIFSICVTYMTHRLFRNAFWDEEKENASFSVASSHGPYHYSLRHSWLKLLIGILLLTVWKNIELGWLWLIIGCFLIVVGVAPVAGLLLNKLTKEPDFEWEPLSQIHVKKEVKKKKYASLVFLGLIALWIYSWIPKLT